jgi:hypothetical protein
MAARKKKVSGWASSASARGKAMKEGTRKVAKTAKGRKLLAKGGHNTMPISVIEGHAKRLKRNPRALAVYKRVLGV